MPLFIIKRATTIHQELHITAASAADAETVAKTGNTFVVGDTTVTIDKPVTSRHVTSNQVFSAAVVGSFQPAPSITSALTASATHGSAFSYHITGSNSPSGYNATGLPAGLTVNRTTGVISGTPTTAGTYNVSIIASNSGGNDAQTLVLTVA